MDAKTKALLESVGVDMALSEKPIDRFQAVQESSSKAEEKPVVAKAPSKPSLNKGPSGVEETRALLKNVKTLEELKKAMAEFDGCALKKTAMNLVFSDGNPEADVMLIGEAPGADEDRQGKPFVGQSGQLLRRIFGFIGLGIDKLYISNVLPYRPPGNRQPTPMEIAMFHPFLEKHIELVNPKCVILVGGTSAKALLDTKEGITKLRGRWLELTLSDGKSLKAMATYHPAYLLRSPSRKREVWKDMLNLKDCLQENL